MARSVLDEDHIHPAVREAIANSHADTLREVQAAVAANAVVVVGMGQNPFPKNARRVLNAKHIPHKYLEYGNYLSGWRQRAALKMWSGWPTLPMVFVKGMLIGGASDLPRLEASGELSKMLA